ncbi:hypothetical protein ACVRXS_07615 [Streptococcus orisratti]|uniref:hypothetical protein n=1 Tax=Streptococcus orisratti TaxID=114652 RepID=UPI00035CB6D8|nr:hypothetical protein [Streptococcus orisratti]
MGKSSYKAARARHNERCRHYAHYYDNLGRQYEAKQLDAEADLKRLNEAKKSLTHHLKDYNSFEQDFKSSCQTGVSDGLFKGDRRDKFDRIIQNVTQCITSDLAAHQENVTLLELAIVKTTLRVADYSFAASSARGMARYFLSALW